jgi:hypothetical protein
MARRNGYVFHQADNLVIESALSRTLGRWSLRMPPARGERHAGRLLGAWPGRE